MASPTCPTCGFPQFERKGRPGVLVCVHGHGLPPAPPSPPRVVVAVAILALLVIALLRAAIKPDHCGRCGAPVASNQLLCRECRYSGTPA